MINIAVDGFAGSGKSGLVKLIAKSLATTSKFLTQARFFAGLLMLLAKQSLKR